MLSALWSWIAIVWSDVSSLTSPTLPDIGGDPPPEGPPPK